MRFHVMHAKEKEGLQLKQKRRRNIVVEALTQLHYPTMFKRVDTPALSQILRILLSAARVAPARATTYLNKQLSGCLYPVQTPP